MNLVQPATVAGWNYMSEPRIQGGFEEKLALAGLACFDTWMKADLSNRRVFIPRLLTSMKEAGIRVAKLEPQHVDDMMHLLLDRSNLIGSVR
jgi:hypothetical protein